MKKLLIFTVSIAINFTVLAGIFPIDFNKTSHQFIPFGGTQFSIITDPTVGLNRVGELQNGGQDPWEGIYLDLQQPVFLDSLRVIELEAYVTNASNQVVLLKFENGSQPNIELTDTIKTTGWQTLTFDFNFAKNNYLDVNTFQATGNYSKVVIFLNGGQTDTETILIDNIRGGVQESGFTLDVTYEDLIWSDEFDQNGPVNPSKWFHQTKLPQGGSWFNGEVQHYTNRTDNSFVENGILKIVAKKESFTDQGETKQYTSARLNSKFAFLYGRVDIRAKLPTGLGTWPALWTLGQNITEDGGYFNDSLGTVAWPSCGEIDIMEHWGNNQNVIHGSLHTPSSFGATQNTGSIYVPNVSDSFYVYSINWSPNQISFMVDGEIYYTYNPQVKNPSTWPFNAPQYFLFNIAMGGVGGPIDPQFTQSTMEVDYIRVYQNSDVGVYGNFLNDDQVKILPNPTAGLFKIEGLETFDQIQVFSMSGEKIKNLSSTNFGDVDLSGLPNGIYFVSIQTKSGTFLKKVSIIH